MTQPLSDLVKRNQIIHPTLSAALGTTVTDITGGQRRPLGVIVDVSADRESVWVRRFYDPADVSIVYGVRELDRASEADLAEIARWFLRVQYGEVRSLQARYRADQTSQAVQA